MNKNPLRPWTGIFQWSGKKPFRAGTVFVSPDTKQHEIERELRREFESLFGRILPDSVARPALINYEPGGIVFVDEETYHRCNK